MRGGDFGMRKGTGKKLVIYFYDDYGIVVDTKYNKTSGKYKIINTNKAFFNSKDGLLEAINRVYNWNSSR